MKKFLSGLLVAAIWLLIWQSAAMLIGQELLLPTPFPC